MQHVAISWLVYELTGSALMLGLIGFANQFPIFIVAPFAGALGDRWSRYRMVVVAQIAAMAQAVVLATLVLTGVVQVWHLVALSAVAGLISGVDIPVRQALLVRLVKGQDDLPNAIALNSSMFNSARLVGPAIAGVLIGWVGEGPIFVINAASYLCVLGALAAIRITEEPGEKAGPVLQNIAKGFVYAFRFEPIRDLLTLLMLVSLVGIPYVVLLPVFARDILGGGASTLGLLTSCAGFGAVLGALSLASRNTVVGLGRVIVRAAILFGATLVAFAFSEVLWLSCALLVASGLAVMMITASINTMLQTLVDEGMRGRVMSLYTMAFIGMSPMGSLAGGAIAARVGAPVAVALGGLGCLALAFWFSRRLAPLREIVYPVYERMGILPEVARGLQTASTFRPKN
jgi:MFS family permease